MTIGIRRPSPPRGRSARRWSGSGREEGQGLAEYSLILMLIAMVAVLALLFLGSQIAGMLSNVGASI